MPHTLRCLNISKKSLRDEGWFGVCSVCTVAASATKVMLHHHLSCKNITGNNFQCTLLYMFVWLLCVMCGQCVVLVYILYIK